MQCKEDFKSLLAAPAQALQGNCQDTSSQARRVPGHGSWESFKQTKMILTSILAICVVQDMGISPGHC